MLDLVMAIYHGACDILIHLLWTLVHVAS